ncbi:MAG: hypothetical protein PSN34_05370 [Urechidicola sp.]|nr:hypothetical protein [Urechidicola sp.]
MKKLMLIIAGALLVVSCSCNDKGNATNTALIEKYVQSVEAMDFDAMDSILDENYMGFGPSINDSINKEQTVSNWKFNVENLYETIKYNKSRNAPILIEDGDNQGNWVANWAELEITFKGSGESVTIWANTNYLIKDGKIVKSYSFYNEADVLEQLGFSYY